MPTIFLLFTFAIVQIRFSEVIRVTRTERNCWLILAWQLVVLPIIFSLALYPLLSDQWYIFAVATLCTSSITATTALSRLFGLNDALALVVCLAGTLLMPLPLLVLLSVGLDSAGGLEMGVYLNRIVIFILVPFLFVYLLRRAITEQTDALIRQNVPYAVLVLLMIFGLSVMDGVQELLFAQPLILLSYIALAFAISIVTHLLTYAVLLRLGVRDAKTACLLCAYRNMGVVAAIAGSSFGEHFLIFVGVWQLPMYTLPLLLKKFYHQPVAPVA